MPTPDAELDERCMKQVRELIENERMSPAQKLYRIALLTEWNLQHPEHGT